MLSCIVYLIGVHGIDDIDMAGTGVAGGGSSIAIGMQVGRCIDRCCVVLSFSFWSTMLVIEHLVLLVGGVI